MEEVITYQGKFIPFTKKQFELRDKLISNAILKEQSKYLKGEFNYANPIIGKDGKYYMTISDDVLEYFTKEELAIAIEFEEINNN
jgi:penicillin-binding protein-related factor A (putative recombinase)